MFDLSRRSFLAGAALLAASTAQAQTQAWPQRPVTFVVPQAAGNSPDILCRVIAEKLSRSLGQQFVVENRVGAANIVGTQAVARSAPDGYTLLFATSAALSTNPFTFKALSYDPVKDFVPVAMVAQSNHFVLVNPEVKAKTFAELIALEKATPGSMTLVVDGLRNLSGLIAQAVNKQAGTGFVLVPYNTASSGMQDIITGRTQVMIQSASVAEPFVKDGSLRAVAVVGNQRLATHPDVPAIAETLAGVDLRGWFMVMAPAGTPAEIVAKLSDEIAKALKEKDVQDRAPTLGFEIDPGDAVTPAGAKRFLEARLATAGKIIRELELAPQ